MEKSMLTDEQSQLLRDEKEALTNVLLRLADLEFQQDTLTALKKAITQLDELFLIVIVGEFNAGKSALVNAMLGKKVMPEGVTPTTSQVTLVKWGEQAAEQVVDESYTIYSYPLPLLKELNIVDSPGTNAIIRRHERLTDEFVPRSDLVLFTTSADRPMTESERLFLQRILAWGKKVVFVLNKIDIFEDETALQEAINFILKHAANILGDTPILFPISAKLAQRASAAVDENLRQQLRAASRIENLENYIVTILDDTARLELKFRNPVGVAENLISQAEKASETQASELDEDKKTADSVESAIAGYEHELQNELAPRIAEVENILQKLELRGLDFFDSTLRLTNIQNLARGDKVRAQFEQQVLEDVPQQIEEQIHRLIDWLVDKDLREWQQVMTYLQRRQALNIDHIVGTGGSPQANRRRELIDTVGKSSRTIVESYDRTKEASDLAAQVETAVAQTALIEAGAVGLGTLVTTAVLSSALDITGMVAAGALAIIGLFVIPHKRKKAKENYRAKMVDMRTNLADTLTNAFTKESEGAVSRLRENVAPYTRYVQSEHDRIQKAAAIIADLRQEMSSLRARIDTAMKKPAGNKPS